MACESPDVSKKTPYREAIGALLYLSTRMRPDISYVVAVLAQVSAPQTELWIAVKRVLAYLKATTDFELCYSTQDGVELSLHADADWTADVENCKSQTGTMALLRDVPVARTSKKQNSIALSSCKSEYYALSEAGNRQPTYERLRYNLEYLPRD